jgi:ribokinase
MIAVVGSLNMDLVVRAPRLPRPGETLSGGPFATYPGGKGANQAVAAARLGARVAMIGRVGDDAFGRELLAGLAADGVDTAAVLATPHTSSGVALIAVEDGGQNMIVIAPGANAALAVADVEAAAALLGACRVLLLQLESPLPAVTRAAQIARAAGATVILNPAPAPAGPLPADLLAAVDYIVPNETEAAALLDGQTSGGPRDQARSLRELLDVPAAVVTIGRRGAAMADATGATLQPAFPVQAVDATAAGDAFIGGFAAALVAGLAPADALRWGCAAGALAATRPGAQASLPSRAELLALLGEQRA